MTAHLTQMAGAASHDAVKSPNRASASSTYREGDGGGQVRQGQRRAASVHRTKPRPLKGE
jgi:hypothetical protein